MRRLLAIALATFGMTWLASPAANADCSIVYTPELVGGVLVLQAHEVCTPDVTETVVVVDVPPTDSGLDSICVAAAITLGEDPFAYCGIQEGGVVEVTPAMAAAALRMLPLPASVLEVQPVNGRTLANFETNFFTQNRAFDRVVRILGQRVQFHIVPSAFEWRFGDGGSLVTREPGAPYPDLDVTHRYLKKGKVAPSVDTTYTAEFRVNGGAWEDVPGSVTIAGAPVDLEVLTATPTLVGYDRG